MHASECLLIDLSLRPLHDLTQTHLESTLGLSSLMLGLDVGVQGGIREVALTAATLEISAFLVLSRTTSWDLFEIGIRYFLHFNSQIINGPTLHSSNHKSLKLLKYMQTKSYLIHFSFSL